MLPYIFVSTIYSKNILQVFPLHCETSLPGCLYYMHLKNEMCKDPYFTH